LHWIRRKLLVAGGGVATAAALGYLTRDYLYPPFITTVTLTISFLNVVIILFSGALAIILFFLSPFRDYVIKKIAHKLRVFRLEEFWKPFADTEIAVVTVEYPPPELPPDKIHLSRAPLSKENEMYRLAAYAELCNHSFTVVTKPMAFALAKLKPFLESISKEGGGKGSNVSIYGDMEVGNEILDRNVVLLGSKEGNRAARVLLRILQKEFDIPYFIDPGNVLRILTDLHHSIHAKIDSNGNGEDYAIVLKSCYKERTIKKYLVNIAGCYPYATEAAAEALCDPNFMRSLGRFGSLDNMTFITKVDVINRRPKASAVYVYGGRQLVTELRRKKKLLSPDYHIICPRLANPVALDGKWSTPFEWRDALELPAEAFKLDIWPGDGDAHFKVKHDDKFLYVLVDYVSEVTPNGPLINSFYSDFVGVFIDCDFNGGTAPQPDDYGYYVGLYPNGDRRAKVVVRDNKWDWWHTIESKEACAYSMDPTNDPYSSSSHLICEFRIPRPQREEIGLLIEACDTTGGLNGACMMSWPSKVWDGVPAAWGVLEFSE